MNRFFNTLQSRLLFTHMLVALTVLVVAALLLLVIQAPLRTETMLQRMAEWLQPTVVLARSNFASLRAAGDDATAARFFDYLHTQADAQNARILLVTQPGGAVVFDSEERLTGQTWQAGNARRFEFSPRRMRGGGMMGVTVEATRGVIDLEGSPWHYVSTTLLPLYDGSVDLVMLRAQPGLLRSMGESIAELPRGLLIGGLLVLAAAVFLLSRWTAGAVTRNLSPLIEATRALARGNLAYRVDAAHVSLAEVNALAASFNQMADRVQQSQQAQRDFVAHVSHDLKTPLTSIQGYSQALIDGTVGTPDAQQRAALIINQEAQRLTHLVEEVIDLARLESGRLHLHLQAVDANELGAEAIDGLRPLAEAANVTLEWSPLSAPLPITADAARLRRALANLLDNALKHTPPGGKVTLAGEATEDGRQMQYTVSDTGPGIPPEEVERIWERFYRVDRARTGRSGSGLGLAIVKEIVEAHGGSVGVESVVGQGSRFWIRVGTARGERVERQIAD
jgi:YD repeat-containing protein